MGRRFYTTGGRQPDLREQLAGQTMGGRWCATYPNALDIRDQTHGYELCRVSVAQEDAGPWTVTLCPPPWGRCSGQDYDDVAPTEPGRIYARVWFGNGGVTQYVDVDWGLGCSFVVWGSEVRVNVIAPQVIGGSIPEGVRRTVIEAFLTPGASPTECPITRTVHYGELVQYAAEHQPIPSMAKRWWLLHSYPEGVNMSVEFLSRCGATVRTRCVFAITGNINNPLWNNWRPVPYDANVVEITNVGNDTVPRMVYELAL